MFRVPEKLRKSGFFTSRVRIRTSGRISLSWKSVGLELSPRTRKGNSELVRVRGVEDALDRGRLTI